MTVQTQIELQLRCRECGNVLYLSEQIHKEKGVKFVYVEPCEKCKGIKAKETLKEVVGWIDGWEPDFVDDPNWEVVQEMIDEVLGENI